MRIVAAPDGRVDRTDRALWLTRGFDIGWAPAGLPGTIDPARAVVVAAPGRLDPGLARVS